MNQMKTIAPALIATLALVGCNNDANQTALSTQIKTLEVYEQGAEGKLTPTKQYRFEYQQGRLAQINSYGTDPNKRIGYVLCSYQGKISQSVIDQEQQTQLPDGWRRSPTGEILIPLLGLDDREYSLCAFDQQNAALMTETEYSDKLEQTKPLFTYTWSSTQQNSQQINGFTTVVNFGEGASPIPECPDSFDCDLLLFGFHNMTTRYVQLNSHMLVNTARRFLYVYEFEKKNIKTKKIYQYTGDDLSQLSTQLDQLTLLDQVEYRYAPNQVQRCGQQWQMMTYWNQQRLLERQTLGAGADGVACTVDDVVVRQEKFSY